MPEALKQPKLVLVEGKDEVHFFSAVIDHLGFTDIEVRSFEGVDNLRGTLRALTGIEGYERLVAVAVVRDAEGNGRSAFQAVQDALRNADLPVPPAALQPTGRNPAVVVLINPHEQPDGRFDDVCAESVQGTSVMGCVEEYLHCLRGLGPGIPARGWKTRIHAYIAAQERPEVSLGIAARRGYFPLDHPAFAAVRNLFELVENR
jgi:hypothetical protein